MPVSTIRTLCSRRMLVALFMGFSSGLPLLLTMSTLQAWMKISGISLTTIGLISLVQVPYSLKFLWAPVMDRFVPPILGRRRGWLLILQTLLALSIFLLANADPVQQPLMLAFCAILVAFLGASQDIVADAYRRESFADNELGLGSSVFIVGYRVAMLVASGGALVLADTDYLGSWPAVYIIMGGLMAVGVLTSLLAPEPKLDAPPPKTFQEAVVGPFVEYFKRDHAMWILSFILLYKLGDTLASNMTVPFYLDIGFQAKQIGIIAKSWGFAASLLGGIAGGVFVHKYGIVRGLIICGILQAITIPSFSGLALIGPNIIALTVAITLETFTAGMGSSAYVAFMGSITHKRFSATQYALFSSLMSIPRTFLASPTGNIAQRLTEHFNKPNGWAIFFVLCMITAIPGLFLIPKIKRISETAQ